MGSGSFSLNDYRAYATNASYRGDGTRKTVSETFTRRNISQNLDPRNAVLRESCDSTDSPESQAVIIALDVTGSMGFIASDMVAEHLGTLMNGILETRPIAHPHMMFMAVGDAACDAAPLQVSQFEADIRIAKQLTEVYVEGGGGGNMTESYDLPWYFAAQRTAIDCFSKRNKKGYLFTIGDERAPAGLTKTQIARVFGINEESGFTPQELLAMAEKKYNVFHVVVEQGSYASRDPEGVKNTWLKLLGDHTIFMKDYRCISEIIVAVMRVNEGENPEVVIESYPHCKEVVRYALYGNKE
jgi:hypothetical protein